MSKTAHRKIRGDKAIKKKIAEFLADYDLNYSHVNIKDLLTRGHRGYLAMSEKDLCSEFEKRQNTIINDESFDKLPKTNTGNTWSPKEYIQNQRLKMMADAKLISDEIFEKVCLA